MADYGLKIAQAGYDVGTASDQHLVMTSKLNSHKIYTSLQGSFIGTVPAHSGVIDGNLTVNISHNLGYIPAAEFWYKNELGNWKSPFFGLADFSRTIIQPDSSNIKIFNDSAYINYIDSGSAVMNFYNRDNVAHAITVYYMFFVDVSA